MKSSREQADELYELLTNKSASLKTFQREIYENKLLKLVDILKNSIKDEYYIQRTEVEIWDILEFQNINYIYNKLKDLELYSNAKEV